MQLTLPSVESLRKPLRFLSLALLSVLLASCLQVKSPNPRPNVRLAPAPYFDNKTGIYFPGALDALHRQPLVDLEERSPGLGFAISYRNSEAKLDVFVYDLQASVIPTGIDSPVIQRSFDDALSDIEEATDKRIYTNFQLHETGTLTLAGTPFLHARFSYGENTLLKDGDLLVSGINGQIVKIRSSIARPPTVDVSRALGYLAQSIAQSRRNGYGGLVSAQLKRLEAELARIDLADGVDDREAVAIAQMEIVKQRRHNRFDAASPELLADSQAHGHISVRFARFPMEPAIPTSTALVVNVSPDGEAVIVREQL